jgi:hypothetical protein
MHIEHLTPRAQGGRSVRMNLWLSCAWCNSYKGTQTEAIDPETGMRVGLFNPRIQVWSEHFRWTDDGLRILGPDGGRPRDGGGSPPEQSLRRARASPVGRGGVASACVDCALLRADPSQPPVSFMARDKPLVYGSSHAG